MFDGGKGRRMRQAWHQAVQFFKPNRLLKYFPPAFQLRNPAMSLLDLARMRGDTCGVAVLYLEGMSKLMLSCAAEEIEALQEMVRSQIISLAPEVYGESQVIAATQMQEDVYVLYISSRHIVLAFEEISAKSNFLQRELEKRLKKLERESFSQLAVHAGVQMIDAKIKDTRFAAKLAYHYALDVAMKKLPADFSPVRQELVRIIEQEDLTVLAQPIILLSTGEIFGWEFLARGPQHSPFYRPDQLFEFAHQADLLTELEFLIFRKAFESITDARIEEQVFVNLTAVTLCHPAFYKKMKELIVEYPEVDPHNLIFELTERHSIHDYHHAAAVMRKCRELGIRFAVDDAGAGYSSLHSISELIPDIIKIDKSVIQNIDREAVKQSLLQAMLSFAKKIDCEVIAEGVERPEEAFVLFQHEVPLGQGFYFARPSSVLFTQETSQLEQLRDRLRKLRGQNLYPEFGS